MNVVIVKLDIAVVIRSFMKHKSVKNWSLMFYSLFEEDLELHVSSKGSTGMSIYKLTLILYLCRYNNNNDNNNNGKIIHYNNDSKKT